MNLTRRHALRLLGASAVAVPAAGLLVAAVRDRVDTVGRVAFTNRLQAPPLAPSRLDSAGRRVFDLRIRAGQREFVSGRPSSTWGVDSDYLGPTLRARRGERVLVNVANGVDETTTLHWHGMHLPPEMDGGPYQPIEPGATWSPTWTIDQPAASLWYHPHPHGRTARHLYRGLAGMFLVDDNPVPGLPHRYGIDDVPLIVQDRRLDGGRLDPDEPMSGTTGFLGDHLLVNGILGPYLEVTTTRIRLRLLNGSNARVYDFAFADGRPFAQIASDGGLLSAPHGTRHVQLAPGERAEIVVALTPGERVVLRSASPATGAGLVQRDGGADRFDVLELRAAPTLTNSPELPDHLAALPPLPAHTAVRTRTFELAEHHINGRKMDPRRIDARVGKDTTEIWEVRSGDGTLHTFHVHDVQFQVLSVDDRKPPPELSGWKDTVLLPPGTRMRLIMRFADYADPHRPYMFHCHMLYHEDQGMMGQFLVLDPGQAAAPLPLPGGHPSHH
ncbi:multicopper oxidase family protein [Streptosporangium roseum]|uniref:Multicopper oxidase CueO n=1 Tax=Streptosporangium roseum (strain ATCC 12428 / DSM 43021 / JCM 3005 / KCTC 9067 / NCIMB 10171 / NRRL 2505 / NI 9100) TaxID=479432 RepID=D2B6Y2_STRRD|nr:multicopper oxidase domain-containing protein [Streptosporangium roseum]ACZ87720.1 Bilirubin oxidase [Streptosporangium roseum DSM 43021]